MEQADAGESHDDAVLIAHLDHIVVSHGAAGLGDVFHAALLCALQDVYKRQILIRENGEVVLTRKRECFEDLVKDFVEVEL